jgi:hypothetical protein
MSKNQSHNRLIVQLLDSFKKNDDKIIIISYCIY